MSSSQKEYRFQSVILISTWNAITQCAFPGELSDFEPKIWKIHFFILYRYHRGVLNVNAIKFPRWINRLYVQLVFRKAFMLRCQAMFRELFLDLGDKNQIKNIYFISLTSPSLKEISLPWDMIMCELKSNQLISKT